MLLVGAFIVSLIPAIALFLWMRKQQADDIVYKKNCNKALVYGLVCVLPVLLCSATLHIIGNVSGLRDIGGITYAAYYTIGVLAFSEELVKYLALRMLLKRISGVFSWLNVVVFMVSIAIGFELLEALVYAFGSGAGPMFVRGITIMHGAFGFVMGYFVGKSIATGKKGYAVLGFILALAMHGIYDFGLDENVAALGDWTLGISLGLAVLSIVLIILLIRFVRKARTQDKYTRPIGGNPVAVAVPPENA